MATDTLPPSLGFLTDAAHLLATTSPEISAHLMTQRNSLMFDHDLQQSDIQRQHVCGCCGHILIPGRGSELKLETNKTLLRRKKQKSQKKTEHATKTAAEPEADTEMRSAHKIRKCFRCGMCGRSTAIVIPPAAAPVPRRPSKPPTKIPGVHTHQSSIPAHTSAARHVSVEPGPSSANASSKKRAKSRKQGLQALLQQSQSSSSQAQGGLGLSLSDFLKK